ncbi:glycoside hydrolase family 3 protein [Paenibacillus sanfengchensis]|uniref:glycoside hydrolase family 3 protein n=1 Tax=Paenibacillus sanfengchensis TaxID=3119819 RepID=UPI002FE1530D
MTLGAAGVVGLTQRTAELAAKEMIALGINFNFAPCVDVNNNPANPVIGVRSFGEDPDKVAEHGAAAIRGYQQTGVIAAAKHFPGHGDTTVDSHRGLAVVPHDKQRLHRIELVPFVKAIGAGVDAIMTAHVAFPAFEPEGTPATLSGRVLTDLLRGELGFEGVIVTDCLEMHAISKSCGIAEGAVRAIEAGADLVLVSHTLGDQIAAIRAVREAVAVGRLSEEVINRSAGRVLALKEKRIGKLPPAPEKKTSVPVPLTPQAESGALLTRVAESSVTLVKDTGNLPFDPAEGMLVVWPELRHRTEVDEPAVHRYTLADALRRHGERVSLSVIGTHPTEREIEDVLKQSRDFSQIVVVTYTAEGEIPEGQARLVQDLNLLYGSRFVVVSSRNPYDLQYFPEVGTYLCLYENRSFALDALANVLTGTTAPRGSLPVSLDSRYRAGFRLP